MYRIDILYKKKVKRHILKKKEAKDSEIKKGRRE